MIGFTIPLRLWPAEENEGTDAVQVEAFVRWDEDDEQPTLDLRLPPGAEGNQALVNVAWTDVDELYDAVRSQKRQRDMERQRAEANG